MSPGVLEAQQALAAVPGAARDIRLWYRTGGINGLIQALNTKANELSARAS